MGGMSGRPGDEFECASCHGVFIQTRGTDEALAEMAATWQPPHDGGDDLGIICEDCFQGLIARVRAEAPELLR